MREFRDRACASLVAREFWLDNRRVSCACYVTLSLTDGENIGWWFNDDPEEWQSEPVETVAQLGAEDSFTIDGTLWRYPQVDLAWRFGVRGKPLSRWVARSVGSIREARLEFADGTAIIFSHDCRLESEEVRIFVQ